MYFECFRDTLFGVELDQRSKLVSCSADTWPEVIVLRPILHHHCFAFLEHGSNGDIGG